MSQAGGSSATRSGRRWSGLVRHAGRFSLALVAGWFWGAYSIPSPMRTLELRELGGAVVRGGTLDLVATVDQRRPCLTTSRRWLWRPDPLDPGGVEWVFLSDAPFKPPLLPGRDRYRLRLPVPSWVEEGDWHYLAEGEDECSPFDLWRWISPSRRSRDVPIVIASRPVPAQPQPTTEQTR